MTLIIIAGSANVPLAAAIAAELGARLAGRRIQRFADAELHVEIEESVRDQRQHPTRPALASAGPFDGAQRRFDLRPHTAGAKWPLDTTSAMARHAAEACARRAATVAGSSALMSALPPIAMRHCRLLGRLPQGTAAPPGRATRTSHRRRAPLA